MHLKCFLENGSHFVSTLVNENYSLSLFIFIEAHSKWCDWWEVITDLDYGLVLNSQRNII